VQDKTHIDAAIPQQSKHKHTAWRFCGHQSSASTPTVSEWHGMAGNESIKQQAATGDVRQGSQREKLR
jgi:hypothetical protein